MNRTVPTDHVDVFFSKQHFADVAAMRQAMQAMSHHFHACSIIADDFIEWSIKQVEEQLEIRRANGDMTFDAQPIADSYRRGATLRGPIMAVRIVTSDGVELAGQLSRQRLSLRSAARLSDWHVRVVLEALESIQVEAEEDMQLAAARVSHPHGDTIDHYQRLYVEGASSIRPFLGGERQTGKSDLSDDERGRVLGGIQSLTEALQLCPSHWPCPWLMGKGQRLLGNLDEALLCFQQAYAIAPMQVDVLLELGARPENLD